MVRQFIYSWLGYWLLVLLLPVHSIYPAVVQAFFLQFGFVVLVLFGYAIVCPGFKEVAMPGVRGNDIPLARALLRASIYMSLLGFACLLFDKIYIQQIDYSSGLAVAREQWRELGEDREGKASSIWSVLGYALGSGYYVTAVLVITQAHRFTNRERLIAILLTFLFALLNSIITGGRSNFMLLAVIALAALSARRGLHLRQVFSSARQWRYIRLICVATAAYIVYIFYARASASDELVYAYVQNFLPYEGVEFDEWYRRSVNEGWIGTFGNMCVLVFAYLSHSFATTAAIVDAATEDKTIIFSNFASILYKFGILGRPDGEWFLEGRFPSVPGALWHQLGLVGYLLISPAIGVCGAVVSLWAKARPRRLVPLGAYVLTATTWMLTPYVFAPDFLSFPSVVVAFFGLAMVCRIGLQLRSQGQRAAPAPCLRAN